MSDGDNNSHRGRIHVRGGFLRHVGGDWQAVTAANIDAQIVFAAEVDIDAGLNKQYEVAIELWRGDQPRDRCTHRVFADDLPWHATYRVNWSDRSGASSRLRCSVFVDGTRSGMWQLLIQSSAADAQGRLQFETRSNDSLETMLAYEDEFAALVERFRTFSR